ncbi:TPA: hypothetical protein ACXLVA_002864 [Legionella anisa]
MAGFFSNRVYVQHEPGPRADFSFINVGNEQFHAVAVALILCKVVTNEAMMQR